MRTIVKDRKRQGLELDMLFYTQVRCDILKHETPWETRQMIAGLEQAAAQEVTNLQLSDVAENFLLWLRKSHERGEMLDYNKLKEILVNSCRSSGAVPVSDIGKESCFVCSCIHCYASCTVRLFFTARCRGKLSATLTDRALTFLVPCPYCRRTRGRRGRSFSSGCGLPGTTLSKV